MPKSCCEKSQRKPQECCTTGSGECCSIVWGDKAKEYDEADATCVINCKNADKCCSSGKGCTLKCKGKSDKQCEIHCGCCSIVVEKSRDDISNYCKVTYCEDTDSQSDKKKTISCCLREACTEGKFCVVKCGGDICCVIKG